MGAFFSHQMIKSEEEGSNNQASYWAGMTVYIFLYFLFLLIFFMTVYVYIPLLIFSYDTYRIVVDFHPLYLGSRTLHHTATG